MSEKRFIDIIPKITQWEGIEYVRDYQCPNGCSSICDTVTKPDLVGWCETPQGFMMVFECPICFTRFRCHCNSGDKFDLDRFDYTLYQYVFSSSYVRNAKEIYARFENS